MENVVIKYSEFFEDDGGMAKVMNDFSKMGDNLISEAKRVKKEFNDSFSLENPESLAKYEAQVAKLVKVNEAYEQAKRDLIEIQKAYEISLKNNTQAEINNSRAKEAAAKATKAELAAEIELNKGIKAENDALKSNISLQEAQRRQREATERATRRQKDAYGEMSAELNQLFRAAASVAVQMYRLEEAGEGNTASYARLKSEFDSLQSRALKLDVALKGIDKSLGRNQRNVGNYQFDAIGNSLQQILREAPSAAVSLNTFFLAISNNLPMFFDSIGDLKKEIQQLKDVAAAAVAQLQETNAAREAAAQVSETASESLATEVESVLSSVAASKEQAAAIREQITAHVAEIETNGVATASTIENTEAVLLNAGASAEQVVAMQRQIAVTGEAAAVTASATASLNAEAAAAARATAALAAQPSVLQRIKSSLFSVNTALTLGVLGLTLFGGKLVDLLGDLLDFNNALNEVDRTTQRLNKSQAEGQKEFVKQADTLKQLQQTAKDETLSMDARMVAVEKLREQFQYYYKDLSDAQILSKDYAKTEKDLLKAIEARTQAQARQKQVDDIKAKIVDLRNELKERDAIYGRMAGLREEAEKLQATDMRTGKIRKFNSKEEFMASLKRGAEIKEELAALQKKADQYEAFTEELGKTDEFRKRLNDMTYDDIKREADALERLIIPAQKEINDLAGKAILLDYKQKEAKKALRKEQINSVDYQAAEFEYLKQMVEATIENNRAIFESDKYTLDQRLKAQELFIAQSKTLAEMERDEALRQLEKTYEKERTATIRSADGQTKIQKYTQKGLVELKKQYDTERLRLEEEYGQKIVVLLRENEKVSAIQQIQMQIQKLERDRQYFSKSASMYADYTRQISALQNQINQIVTPFEGQSLSDQIQINDNEIARVKELRAQLDKLLNGRQLSDLNPLERKSILKEIEKFEKTRARSEKNYEVQRKQNRLKAIEDEQKQYEADTNEFKRLETERQGILLQLENKAIDDMLEAQKEKAEKFKKFMEDVNAIVGLVLDKMIEQTQKRVGESQKMVEKQADAVQNQEERARNGLSNTLAFEQEQLAKREAELLKQQKREQRLQKIKSLYSAYSGYADKDPDTAIQKALRDFAILEAITATFADGGIVGVDGMEKVRTTSKGITRGRRHSMGGGVLAYHEGGEGFFSRKEVANMGEGTFYKMKELAAQGKIDENFFSRQRQDFVRTVTVPPNNQDVVEQLQEVKRAIQNQPIPNWRVAEVANGTMKLVEETITQNKVKRDTYIIKKPRP